MPRRFSVITSPTPSASNSFVMATPAAPMPRTTTRTSFICLPTTRNAFVESREDDDGGAVLVVVEDGDVERLAQPFLDLETTRGAAMSSRLIPPKTGAMHSTVRTISSVSWVARQIGQASTSANRLKSNALPSMTGRAASGPMLPRPSTAEPSVTTATVLRLIVRLRTAEGSLAIAIETRATPGV